MLQDFQLCLEHELLPDIYSSDQRGQMVTNSDISVLVVLEKLGFIGLCKVLESWSHFVEW